MKGLFIGFIILQIGIDLAHSVTVFPFVHYGMFSESVPAPDSLPVFEVTVNGRLLRQADYRIYRWDMIESPVIAFDRLKSTGDFAFDREKLREYLQRAGGAALYRLMEPRLENRPAAVAGFPRWYKAYLGSLLGYPVDSLRVDRSWYVYKAGGLLLLRKEHFFTI